jgi:transcription elongation factor GreA
MEDVNAITPEGRARLEAELDELEGAGRRTLAERIKTAREWGDLKENSEYHDAKNDQAHLETRIARLRDKLARAVVVDPAPSGDVVTLGSSVLVCDENGQQRTWRLVSSHEASPSEGLLSFESPVARALAGRRPGDQVRIPLPRGERTLTVVAVS